MPDIPLPNKSYELEFAINTSSEKEAIKTLSQVFGENIVNKINMKNITKYGDLFFVNYCFSENELSDKNYKNIEKNNNLLVLSDKLTIERAAKLIEYCHPVEIQLKKLLTYVYPSILGVFDGMTDKKSRIKLCKQISSWNLGDLLERLEFDLSIKERENLFLKDSHLLTAILKESNSFNEFKDLIMQKVKPNTVWDQVCVILENPINYMKIKEKLHTLRYLRNKAAHPQVILRSDLEIAAEYSKFILEHIKNVKNDYTKNLKNSLSNLAKTLSSAMKQLNTPGVQRVIDDYIRNMQLFSNKLNSIKVNDVISAALSNSNSRYIDWLKIDSEMRKLNPEFKKTMEYCDKKDINTVINEMTKKLGEKPISKK